jgi:peptidoglycan-associated lipoprotein
MHQTRRRLSTAVLAVAFGALVAGCSTTKLDDAAPVESRNVPADGSSTAGAAGGTGSGTAQSNVATVDLSRQGAGAAATGLLAQRTVFFDFDSFVVKDEYRPMLEAHAKVLSANRSKRMTLEGHTDERGGREYNLALGQKRAGRAARSGELRRGEARRCGQRRSRLGQEPPCRA